jgi:hypothetical protein
LTQIVIEPLLALELRASDWRKTLQNDHIEQARQVLNI